MLIRQNYNIKLTKNKTISSDILMLTNQNLSNLPKKSVVIVLVDLEAVALGKREGLITLCRF